MFVDIRFKMEMGVEAKHEDVAPNTADEFKAVDTQITKITELSNQLHKEMSDLRMTGNDEQVVSSATTTKVIVFGIASVGIIIVSAIIQILFLRRFFRQKKIM